MGFGLFGKLPQKRDFVALGIANRILNPIETWLQSGVAASRAELGEQWEHLYLVAPVWRFWIGPAILGTGCTGCLMPSVDRVGRYFPLMAIHMAEPGANAPPPPFAPQGEWYAAVEARLLAALHGEGDVAPETLLAGLADPSADGPGPARVEDGTFWRAPPGSAEADLLAGIVEADYRNAAQVRSYWWTAGSEAAGPVAHARQGLPDPYFYTLMLRLVAE